METMTSSGPSARERINASAFDGHELAMICGALNKHGPSIGANNTVFASGATLRSFTYQQAITALCISRRECIGDSRDDVDDVIYHLRAEHAEMFA